MFAKWQWITVINNLFPLSQRKRSSSLGLLLRAQSSVQRYPLSRIRPLTSHTHSGFDKWPALLKEGCTEDGTVRERAHVRFGESDIRLLEKWTAKLQKNLATTPQRPLASRLLFCFGNVNIRILNIWVMSHLLLFRWISPLLVKGYRIDLSLQDMFRPLKQDDATQRANRLTEWVRSHVTEMESWILDGFPENCSRWKKVVNTRWRRRCFASMGAAGSPLEWLPRSKSLALGEVNNFIPYWHESWSWFTQSGFPCEGFFNAFRCVGSLSTLRLTTTPSQG